MAWHLLLFLALPLTSNPSWTSKFRGGYISLHVSVLAHIVIGMFHLANSHPKFYKILLKGGFSLMLLSVLPPTCAHIIRILFFIASYTLLS